MNAVCLPLPEFLGNQLRVLITVYTGVEFRRVQAEVCAELFQIRDAEGADIFPGLMVVERKGIVPKLALIVGTFRRLGGGNGFGTDKSKVVKDDLDLTRVNILGGQGADGLFGTRTAEQR